LAAEADVWKGEGTLEKVLQKLFNQSGRVKQPTKYILAYSLLAHTADPAQGHLE
jgi:hypothetical protein